MAKEDFCFNYYDGDAARDKAHMNRLQRGAYDDIISAQRKRGHLSLDDIKRVLSGDFELCWAALEWVLKVDDADKYYIEWVDTSVGKMRAHSQKQKDKVNARWGKNKPDQYQNDTAVLPQNNHGIDPVIPLENENGNGIEDEEKGGMGEKTETGEFTFSILTDLPERALSAAEESQFTLTRSKNTDFLKEQWIVFIKERINDPPEKLRQYRQLSDLTSYYLNWVRNKHPKHVKQGYQQVGKSFIRD